MDAKSAGISASSRVEMICSGSMKRKLHWLSASGRAVRNKTEPGRRAASEDHSSCRDSSAEATSPIAAQPALLEAERHLSHVPHVEQSAVVIRGEGAADGLEVAADVIEGGCGHGRCGERLFPVEVAIGHLRFCNTVGYDQ